MVCSNIRLFSSLGISLFKAAHTTHVQKRVYVKNTQGILNHINVINLSLDPVEGSSEHFIPLTYIMWAPFCIYLFNITPVLTRMIELIPLTDTITCDIIFLYSLPSTVAITLY